MSNITIQAKKRTDRTKVQELKSSEDGSLHVRAFGTGTQSRNRWLQLDNAGTREKAEWSSGANITELTFFATPVAGTAAIVGDEYVIVALDAPSDAIANNWLTQAESASADINWIPIPLNTITSIPLTTALTNGSLSGGRVDAKTVGGIALDLWIGAN